MPYLNVVNNVFVKETKNVFCKSRTINGMLKEANAAPDGPFVVMQGHTPILRKDWDIEQNELSAFTVVCVPAGLETGAIFVLTMLASYLVTSYLIDRALPAETQKVFSPKVGPAVFTFDGQQNIQRLNEPVECAYGKNRWYPSYLCAPYVTYVNNQAFLRAWFSLGNGDFQIEDVYVGDNPVSSFPGSQWGYIPPNSGPNQIAWYVPFFTELGDLGGLFDVALSPKDLAGVELKAPNEQNYTEVGFYAVCGHTDIISDLQFNFSFPQGCFDPNAGERTVEVKLTWYKESGQYQGAFYEETVAFTYNTYNPQKISIRKHLFEELVKGSQSTIPGQWQVKVQRLTSIPDNFAGRDQVILESVTALGGFMTVYKTSAIYVALQGSDRMVTDAASKINLVATRKLPVFNGLTWDTLPTRHPVWAAIDVLKAEYGAQQSDDRFDLVYFKSIADKYPDVTFDHVFNQKTTTHEALRSIFRVLRGTPYTAGSDYRVAIDSPYDLPVAFFGPDNAYDMNWSMVMKQELDNDAVSVSYVDPETGLASDVQFTPHGSLGINPNKVSVVGLTSRETAWRTAAYIYQSEVLQRDLIEFSAGLDGFIPMLGDLISVSWPFPAWGQAGIVLEHDVGTLTCSDTLQAVAGQAWIILRSAKGGVLGPYKCNIGTNPNEVIVTDTLPTNIDFDALGKDPVMYAFGSSSTLSRLFRVTLVEPSETNVRITATTYDSSVFAYDTRTVPVDDKKPYPLSEGEVSWIKVEENTEQLLRMTWASEDSPYGYRVRYTWDPVLSGVNDYARCRAKTWYPNYCDTTSDFETADVFGTTAYLRRDIGELFIELAGLDNLGNPVEEKTKVWRAKFADFAQSTGVNTSTVLQYDTGAIRDGHYADVGIGYPNSSRSIKRETSVLKFYTDMPAGAGVKLQLTLHKSYTQQTPVIGKTAEFLFPDTGYLEITTKMLEQKGWQLGFYAERCSYILAKLVNLDLTALTLDLYIADEDWSSYSANSIKLALTTYGQIDTTGYPPPPSGVFRAIRAKQYVGVKARLIQPDGRTEYNQFWDTNSSTIVTEKIGPNLVNYDKNGMPGSNLGTLTENKRFDFAVMGRLNAHVYNTPTLFYGNTYLLHTVTPYLWEDWIVPGGGGFTPKQIFESINNPRFVKFFLPSSQNNYEVDIGYEKYVVRWNFTGALFVDWLLTKHPANADDYTTTLPFTESELTTISNSRMVLCDWDYPTGLVMGQALCCISTTWGGQDNYPYVSSPSTPVPTAYTKNIVFELTCP